MNDSLNDSRNKGSPKIIDLERLLQPISEQRPQGEDLRVDRSPGSDYDTLKDARNSARAAERASMFDDDSGSETLALWRPVMDLAPKILAEKSKDLEVISWYIEALVRLRGFTGLRDGFALAKAMVEHFWDVLYPEPDEDGLETKVNPLSGLNGDGGEGTLLTPMRNAPITTEGAFGDFSYWQYQQAHDASKISDDDKRAERVEALGFSFDNITATIAGGNETFYVNLIDDIEASIEEYKALNRLLREHCGHDAPPSSNIGNLLDEILRAVRFLTKDKLAHLAVRETGKPAADEADTGASPALAAGAAPAGSVGPIRDREDALRRLQEVSNYFRAHEPHTPLAASLDRVVKWGRMTVSELMMELVPDETARAMYTQLTGVKLDGSEEGTYVPPPAPSPLASNYNDPDGGSYSGADGGNSDGGSEAQW